MGCLTKDEFKVVEAMREQGGSFVQALAECFHRADMYNKSKLKAAFPVYWRQYEQLAGINPELPQPEGTKGYQTNVDEHIANADSKWDPNMAEQANQDFKEGQFSGDAHLV
jgi:hypothetical protein